MNKRIKKAVFPVASFGTRFLPATKAMPKELLPIINKPLIQYTVEEAILSGIETLIFVTGRNKRAIEDHFDNNQELEAWLLSKGDVQQAEMVKNILPKGVECIFVRQPEQLGLGHAILCAERAVGGDAFAVLLADDFIVGSNGPSIGDLISAYHATGKTQLSVLEVPKIAVSQYGIIVPNNTKGGVGGLVEKPDVEEAPSNLASIGRYVLTPDIFNILRNQSAGKNNEIQLSDAINIQAQNGCVNSIKLNGLRFDCGSIDGYLNAIMYVAEQSKK